MPKIVNCPTLANDSSKERLQHCADDAREAVKALIVAVRVKNGPDALEVGCLYYPRKQTSLSHAADCDVIACYGGAKSTDRHLASKIHCVDDRIIEWLERREQRAPRWRNAVESSFMRMCVGSRRMFVS